MTGHPKKQPRRVRSPRHVPKALLDALDERDGHVSSWTGREYVRGSDSDVLVPQHRQGGMGGRPDKHRIENLVWLESAINGLITSDANFQTEAMRRGIAISLHADARHVPVLHAAHGGEVWLTADGRAAPTDQEVPF
ncbi:hypothetical protein [Homoserinibacter sp. GY 40078]|uniref:hypothetical protein n=1 Tax=Homoserinibacter sp. GY 40078 TaxID=2603275 RepID=UPI0011C87ADC|nr:hypothetical protein [Homoserinibacter sp. GY 40078]TXK17388.1 hypothetical protein FVQ89_11175 [Homoserinibacter sp. GY 40078]